MSTLRLQTKQEGNSIIVPAAYYFKLKIKLKLKIFLIRPFLQNEDQDIKLVNNDSYDDQPDQLLSFSRTQKKATVRPDGKYLTASRNIRKRDCHFV